MNKKVIISIIAVVLLVAVLGTVLVACNKEDYQKRLEKKGYSKVVSGSDIIGAIGFSSNTIEWDIHYAKDNESVSVVKYKNSDDAKDAYNSYKEDLKDGYAVRRHGKIVVFGTKQGVKDAE